MNLNPLKKISIDKIEFVLNSSSIEFSYLFGEKQEKELNLAAGRKHRKKTVGVGSWNVEGLKVSVVYALSQFVGSGVSFREIADLFEEMVKS
jgi:hypothetical protein